MLIGKTELGQRVMKDRSVTLTPRQRAAFILVDGRKTADQVLAATATVGVTREDIERLLELGLVEAQAGAAAASAPAPIATQPAGDQKPQRTPQERYAAAYPIATALTAGLGLRGFRLNLAVEAAGSYEQLLQVVPKIRDAVGPEKFRPLESVLNG